MNQEVYPPNWRELRDACIERAGYRCEQCGIPQGWLTFSKSGKPYLIYLSAAHRYPHQTYRPDAELMALCQACHRRYDRPTAPRRYYPPLLQVHVLVGTVLVGIGRNYYDVYQMVAALEAGTSFEVAILVNQVVVGCGAYVVEEDGTLLALSEQGACEDLFGLFDGVVREPVSARSLRW